MESYIEKDKKFLPALRVIRVLLVLIAIAVAVRAMLIGSRYELLNSLSTLLVIPALALIRHLFRWKGGWQLEFYIYCFCILSWSIGGALELYDKVPYFDKVVHCLSGVFVSLLALALFSMLERRRSPQGEINATACFFTFFASMAVAGMFELCEYFLSPIAGRDMQHVLETGVSDTMGDMFVCMLGTIVVILILIRACRGGRNPFTDAARAFVLQNPAKEKK